MLSGMNAFPGLSSTQGHITMTLLVWEKDLAPRIRHEAAFPRKHPISPRFLSALRWVGLREDPHALLPLAETHPATLNPNLGQCCGWWYHSTH